MLGVLLCLEGLFALALSFENFEKNCLQATNQLRRRHGVPDLTWSEALAADAQTWANSLAKSDTFEHDYNGMQSRNQGENLAYFKPYKKKCQGIKRDDCVQCREIIDDWYDEVKNYDFGMGRPKAPGSVVMHFTQEVWKNTRQFGIGTARSNRYGFILVARYSPRGNRGGPVIFKDNVFPPGILSDPTPSTNPTAAIITSAPPTPITPRSSATANISVNISVKNVTGSPSLPTSAPTSEGTNSPTSLPSSPTTAPSVAQTGPSGPSKTDSSKCQYFVVNSTTYTYAIIQKCKGKPNVTFIQQGTPPPVTTTTRIPETTTQPVTTPTSPPNPCQPNPCKNGGTCKPEGQNFNCSCPNGYSGPLCEERGPSKEERKDALILTNMYRAMHQAPELTWNREMAAKAQDWADKLAREGRLVHENESSTDYGENLAEVGSEEKALLRAIDAWYEEAALYNFQEPKFSTDTGHFSQLVWSATNEVGMAKAKTRDNTNVYVVARYKPAGNVVDQFPSNVKPKQ